MTTDLLLAFKWYVLLICYPLTPSHVNWILLGVTVSEGYGMRGHNASGLISCQNIVDIMDLTLSNSISLQVTIILSYIYAKERGE